MVRSLRPGARLGRLVLLLFFLTGTAQAGSVTVAWDPNVESDLAGYIVSWGTQPGLYTQSRDVGNVVAAPVDELASGTRYYFAVQAYNTSGLTSAYSEEVTALVPAAAPVAPTVTSITPSSGPSSGGTAISVKGTGFVAGLTLTLGGVPAVGVTVLNATTATAVTPPHAAGVVAVVAAANGLSSPPLAGGFTFTPPPVRVREVSPKSGLTDGGLRVTIAGDEFGAGATVTFGGAAAADVVVVDARTITAVTPPHVRGPVAVAVRNPSGETGSAQAFTYVDDDAGADTDGDGLPDWWEHRYGLDPNSTAGEDGALGDPDGDGISNVDEFRQGTHPRGTFRRYFAEGVNSSFFTTEFSLVNPSPNPVTVVLTFFTSDATRATLPLTLASWARATVNARDLPALADLTFSTTVEADALVVVDRRMWWDETGYGGHAETAIEHAATRWYFAEGATHSGFDLFYLLQNPEDTAATIEIRYLLPEGAPIVKSYKVPARSRYTIWVDLEDEALALTDVSAVITSTNGVPIIAERSMYLYVPDQPFGAGHNSAGVLEPSLEWFLAEGATGRFFDLFVLIANPGDQAAGITATYLLPDGRTIEKAYEVGPNSRRNIWVNYEDPRLADTAVSTTIRVTNGVPVIVERSMWWPGVGGWTEAHNAPGATATASRWAIAQGEEGGPRQTATYVLLANTSATDADVRVTLLFEDGTTAPKIFRVPGHSRLSVAVGMDFPIARERRFGALVEGLGDTPPQLVVECATYWNALEQWWAAGTDALATPLTGPPADANTMPAAVAPAPVAAAMYP